MAMVLSLDTPCKSSSLHLNFSSPLNPNHKSGKVFRLPLHTSPILCKIDTDQNASPNSEDGADGVGVRAALSALRFYKREISPLLPKSCRYVPTCSEYSMIAYKKYGFVKGSILTTWRLCRCNPFGGSGFDPPRWFDEDSPPKE